MITTPRLFIALLLVAASATQKLCYRLNYKYDCDEGERLDSAAYKHSSLLRPAYWSSTPDQWGGNFPTNLAMKSDLLTSHMESIYFVIDSDDRTWIVFGHDKPGDGEGELSFKMQGEGWGNEVGIPIRNENSADQDCCDLQGDGIGYQDCYAPHYGNMTGEFYWRWAVSYSDGMMMGPFPKEGFKLSLDPVRTIGLLGAQFGDFDDAVADQFRLRMKTFRLGVLIEAETCSDYCSALASCGECGAASECAWCSSTNECHSKEDIDATCPAEDILEDACCEECSAHTKCGSCAEAAGCGWCSDTETCMSGTHDAPCADCEHFHTDEETCPHRERCEKHRYRSRTPCHPDHPYHAWQCNEAITSSPSQTPVATPDPSTGSDTVAPAAVTSDDTDDEDDQFQNSDGRPAVDAVSILEGSNIEVAYSYSPTNAQCSACAKLVDEDGDPVSSQEFCATSGTETLLLGTDVIQVGYQDRVRLCALSSTGGSGNKKRTSSAKSTGPSGYTNLKQNSELEELCCSDVAIVQPIIEIHSINIGDDVNKAAGEVTIVYTFLTSPSSESCIIPRNPTTNEPIGAGAICERGERITTSFDKSIFALADGDVIVYCVEGLDAVCTNPTVAEPENPPTENDDSGINVPAVAGGISAFAAIAVVGVLCCRRGGMRGRGEKQLPAIDEDENGENAVIGLPHLASTASARYSTPYLPESESAHPEQLDDVDQSDFEDDRALSPKLTRIGVAGEGESFYDDDEEDDEEDFDDEFSLSAGRHLSVSHAPGGRRHSLLYRDDMDAPVMGPEHTRSRISMVSMANFQGFETEDERIRAIISEAAVGPDTVSGVKTIVAVESLLIDDSLEADPEMMAAFVAMVTEMAEFQDGELTFDQVKEALKVVGLGANKYDVGTPTAMRRASTLQTAAINIGTTVQLVDIKPEALKFVMRGASPGTAYSYVISDVRGAVVQGCDCTDKSGITTPIDASELAEGLLHARFTLRSGLTVSSIFPKTRTTNGKPPTQHLLQPTVSMAASDLTDSLDLPEDQQFVLDRVVSMNRRALKRQETKLRRLQSKKRVEAEKVATTAESLDLDDLMDSFHKLGGNSTGRVITSDVKSKSRSSPPELTRQPTLSFEEFVSTMTGTSVTGLNDVRSAFASFPQNGDLTIPAGAYRVAVDAAAVEGHIDREQKQHLLSATIEDEESISFKTFSTASLTAGYLVKYGSVSKASFSKLNESFAMFKSLEANATGRVRAIDVRRLTTSTALSPEAARVLDDSALLSFQQFVLVFTSHDIPGVNALIDAFDTFPIANHTISIVAFRRQVDRMVRRQEITTTQCNTLTEESKGASNRMDFETFCVTSTRANVNVRYALFSPSALEWREGFDANQKEGVATSADFLAVCTAMKVVVSATMESSLPAEMTWTRFAEFASTLSSKKEESESDSEVEGDHSLDDLSWQYDFLTSGKSSMSFEDFVQFYCRGTLLPTGLNSQKQNFHTFPRDIDGKIPLGLVLQQLDDLAKVAQIGPDQHTAAISTLRTVTQTPDENDFAVGVTLGDFVSLSRPFVLGNVQVTYSRHSHVVQTEVAALWKTQFELTDWKNSKVISRDEFECICRYFGATAPVDTSATVTEAQFEEFVSTSSMETEKDGPSLDLLSTLFDQFDRRGDGTSVSRSVIVEVLKCLVSEHKIPVSFVNKRKRCISEDGSVGGVVTFDEFAKLVGGRQTGGWNDIKREFCTFPRTDDAIDGITMQKALDGLVLRGDMTQEERDTIPVQAGDSIIFTRFIELTQLPVLDGLSLVHDLTLEEKVHFPQVPGKPFLSQVFRKDDELIAMMNCDNGGSVDSIKVMVVQTGETLEVMPGQQLRVLGLPVDEVSELRMMATNRQGAGETTVVQVHQPHILSFQCELYGLSKMRFGASHREAFCRAIADLMPEAVSHPDAVSFVSTTGRRTENIRFEIELDTNCLQSADANMTFAFALVKRSNEICEYLNQKTAFADSKATRVVVSAVRNVTYPRVGRLLVTIRKGENLLAHSRKSGLVETHVEIGVKDKTSTTRSLIVSEADPCVDWNHKAQFDVTEDCKELRVSLFSKDKQLMKKIVDPVIQLEPGLNDLKFQSQDGIINVEILWQPRKARLVSRTAEAANVVVSTSRTKATLPPTSRTTARTVEE